MIAHCEHQFELDKPRGDGTTRRQHLDALEARGIAQPGLVGPPCPQPLLYLLGWFGELSAARTSNGFGANPISYLELRAWSEVTKRDPDTFDIRVLRRLDVIYLRMMHVDG